MVDFHPYIHYPSSDYRTPYSASYFFINLSQKYKWIQRDSLGMQKYWMVDINDWSESNAGLLQFEEFA